MSIPPIYCLNFRNEDKRQRMVQRFRTLGLEIHKDVWFVEGVSWDDPSILPSPSELAQANELGLWNPLGWGAWHGHLKMLQQFVNSGSELGVTMEDDVMISTNLVQELEQVVNDFQNLNLDVLMLGYLVVDKLDTQYESILRTPNFNYMRYPMEIFGLQMTLMTRSHAQYVLDNFGPGSEMYKSFLSQPGAHHYIPDWIITKYGNRAMVYPMLAIEEHGGGRGWPDDGHARFHEWCYVNQMNFWPGKYF